MTDRSANRSLRKAVWWSVGLRVSGALVLALCAAAGIHVGSSARLALELATTVPAVFLLTRLVTAYRRCRRDGLGQRAALYAVAVDMVSLPALKLMIHEFGLFTSTLRWLTGRWRHGVRDGDMAIPYASGSAALLLAFAYVSAVETVVLAFIIPWPVVREVTLILDIWGVYFIIALFASFVVRPHVIHADGSLRLRYGALLDIRIPAEDIATARVERRTARGRLAVDANGCADLSQGGQTTVTVQLARPVAFTRPLGKTACARTFRYYAADPAAAVAAIRARVPALQTTP
ncbi:MAG: hypothetical protein JO242_01630 [Streptosporangiaceae bacterium]|nr:hypothetical protein [Streptosporangiaceae bacterium]